MNLEWSEELFELLVRSATIVDNRVVEDIDKILDYEGEVNDK